MRRSKLWGFVLVLLFIAINYIPVKAHSPTLAFNTKDKILFTSAVAGSGWELFTVNADGTYLKQLTSLKNLIGDFEWSPDGQYIALTIFPQGFSTALLLMVMNADGSDVRQLSDSSEGGIVWSPDSQQIAFISNRDGLREIYLINRDGNDERRLTHGSTDVYLNDVYNLSWSPDGKQIVFVRSFRLYIVNVDGSGEKPLVSPGKVTTAVAWSPDGNLIAVVASDKQKKIIGIYTMHPDGSKIQKIMDIADDYTRLRWSPDGLHFDYTQKKDGIVALFIVDSDGKNNNQLAPNTLGASWSPDSKQIVYCGSDAAQKSTLYIVDFDGQNKRVLPGNNFFDNSPVWSPAK